MSSPLEFIEKILKENPEISVDELKERLLQESIIRIKEMTKKRSKSNK